MISESSNGPRPSGRHASEYSNSEFRTRGLFSRILHPDGRIYYTGGPLSLADAQILLNDDIVNRSVAVGAYLRIDGSSLVLEPGPRTIRRAFG